MKSFLSSKPQCHPGISWIKYPCTVEWRVASNVPASDVASPELTSSNSRSSSVIFVENISHRYENRTALDRVSFEVRHAGLFGLLGPNGSGKTSLFRILSTLMLPTSGRALIMGHDAAVNPDAVRRKIGVVFQAQSIDVKLSAHENLRHQGHLYGWYGSALKTRITE